MTQVSNPPDAGRTGLAAWTAPERRPLLGNVLLGAAAVLLVIPIVALLNYDWDFVWPVVLWGGVLSFTALFGGFLPEDIVGEMTSIGTLFAFILVCAGVWIMRVRRPDLTRGFTVPALPAVAVLGIIVCGAMIYGLGWTNWLRLGVWLVIGLVFYFSYGIKHSKLAANAQYAGR